MNSLTLQSPAKINLYLKILGRYPDGYHKLYTLFHRISLADTLRLEKQPAGFSLRCLHPALSTGEDNLITKAYRLLKQKFPHLGGVKVHLTKRIPMGGGLGGGSSNAAFFLLGMKRLYGLKVSRKELLKIGKRLGADVPFFLWQVNQGVGKERGDLISAKPARSRLYFVLVLSPRGLSTREVYEGFPRGLQAASLTKLSRVVTILSDNLDRKNLTGLSRLLHNDLELSAFRLRPSIRKTISNFYPWGIHAAGMSGSGPTVFGIVSDLRQAQYAARKLRQREPRKKVLICHTF